MKRYITHGHRSAFRADVPDGPLVLARWHLRLPGEHAFWDRYVLAVVSLADVPDTPPAHKQFPAATHEFVVFAVDPDYPDDRFAAGDVGVRPLTPVNLAEQVTTTDAGAVRVAERLAEQLVLGLVHGGLTAEPEGIRVNELSAREFARARLLELVAEVGPEGGAV